jgi:uncharacterized membrane protein YhfC
MIDLTKLLPEDAERIAYAEGFTGTATLFSRISDLEHALYVLIDAIEEGDPQKIANVTLEMRDLLP